jgi:hypothetical protein
MREGLFWLDDLQWSSIKGCLPGRKRRGPRRVDDRRVIQRDYSRFAVRNLAGLPAIAWPRDNDLQPSAPLVAARPGQKMFYELGQIVGTRYENSIDSTAIKAHRSARGKKGAKTKRKPGWLRDKNPCGD